MVTRVGRTIGSRLAGTRRLPVQGEFGLRIRATLATVAVLAAVIGCRANPGSSGSLPSAHPSGFASSGASAPPASLESSNEPSPPSPAPSAVIPGELPGPDATMPPENRLIPGLSIEAIATTAASLGLECESARGGPAGFIGAFTLGCTGYDAEAHAEFHVRAIFWTVDAVSDLDVIVRPGFEDSGITDQLAPPRVISPLAALHGEATSAWAKARIGDSACVESPCTASIDGADLVMRFGSTGGRHFSISGQVPGS